jgi:SAM-dependent methyltransferase
VTSVLSSLAEQFGDIDIYVFDQLLRGRITAEMTVLDAGCGTGRNLVYLLRSGYDVLGVDEDPAAVDAVRRLADEVAPRIARENFRVERIEAMTFPDAAADVVLSSAVLHFARDEQHFWAMLHGMWRVLRPGGMLFCRLASTIGMEGRFRHIAGRRFELLDGAERFLVDEPMLTDATARLGGELLDPIKTSVVQNLRCMTTWVVRKREGERVRGAATHSASPDEPNRTA